MIDDRLVVAGNPNVRPCIQHAIDGSIGGVNNVPVARERDVLGFEVNAFANPVIGRRAKRRLEGINVAEGTEQSPLQHGTDIGQPLLVECYHHIDGVGGPDGPPCQVGRTCLLPQPV